jgi:uncharacterized protein (DUF1800 family)
LKSFSLALFAICAATLPARTAKKTQEPDYSAFRRKLSKDDQILHALDRLTFGPRKGDAEAVRKIGLKRWIELQLHPERIPENAELAKKLEPLESLRMTAADTVRRVARPINAKRGLTDAGEKEPAKTLDDFLTKDQIRTLRTGTLDQKKQVMSSIPENQVDDVAGAMAPAMRSQLMAAASPEVRRKLLLANAPQAVVAYDLTEGKLYRAILSNRQLEEELVDFWYNHFNVFLDKGADRFLVPTYERDAIRPRVLGRFRDLLEATASSPAMLFYLDNWQSVAPETQRAPKGKRPARGLNENYARELMELHTLGVDGGYTQKDIIEVARCFTGWTIQGPRSGGGFTYNDKVHDKGEKAVLGVTIPAGGGKEDAEKVLDILASHPSTARFISKKLAQRFVADDPPPELVARLAKRFEDTNGDIREVMKTMLASKEFFSQGAYHAKVKSPFEMIASAIRATGAQVDFAFPLTQQVAQLGEPLYRKLEPTGYSGANAEWVNSASLLARMNFAMALAQNRLPGVKVDAARFAGEPALVARQLLFTNPTAPTREAIEKVLAEEKEKTSKGPPTPPLVAGLVIGSPDFQRR